MLAPEFRDFAWSTHGRGQDGAIGGYGSGRSLGSSARDTVEDHCALDVNALHRRAVLHPGAVGSVQWPSGASVNFRAVPDGLVLSYRVAAGAECRTWS